MKREGLREAYGKQLVELAKEDKRIVALEADLGSSTMSNMLEKEFPKRHFEMNIAEQNMASFAAGLSLTGKIPFINSFAVFDSGQCYEQIRQGIGTAHLNVKICGSSSGLSDFGDGASHQCIEDIALMRTIPGMTVIEPCDANQVRNAMKAIVKHDGPVYLRINRWNLPLISDENEPFEIGKIYEMKSGKDVVVLTMGLTTSIALEAAEELEREGISVKVENVSTLKPIKNEDIQAMTMGMKAVLTIEEHSVIGGLNSIVCQAIAGKYLGPVESIAINDRYGFSAKKYEVLLEFFGYTKENIIASVKKVFNR